MIHSLKELRDLGNTVIVVEHDKDMMLEADYIIDMGPKAGRLGGEVVFSGTPQEMMKTNTMINNAIKGFEKKGANGDKSAFIFKRDKNNPLDFLFI